MMDLKKFEVWFVTGSLIEVIVRDQVFMGIVKANPTAIVFDSVSRCKLAIVSKLAIVRKTKLIAV